MARDFSMIMVTVTYILSEKNIVHYEYLFYFRTLIPSFLSLNSSVIPLNNLPQIFLGTTSVQILT